MSQTEPEQSDSSVRLEKGEDGMIREAETGRVFTGSVVMTASGEMRGYWRTYCPECGQEIEDSRS